MKSSRKHNAKKLLSTAILAAMLTSVTASASTGITYSSKGILTADGTNIYIDASDYTDKLDSALDANNTTLSNYDATAGDIYENIDAISTGIAQAKGAIAKTLYDMKINLEEDGTVYSSDSPINWASSTSYASSLAANKFTLKTLIAAIETGVTDLDSERNGTVNYYTAGDNTGIGKTDETTTSVSYPMARVSKVNLGINESFVLPSGYYDNSVTVNNNIKNLGSLSKTNITAGQTITLSEGYYTDGTITTASLSSQTEATAAATQILSGYTAWVNGSKVTGSMANNGAVSKILDAGTMSYTIPEGYHNGSGKVSVAKSNTYKSTAAGTNLNTGANWSASLNCGESVTVGAGAVYAGKVTAASLSSQTSATATDAQILSGYTAWVNGSEVTGTIANNPSKTVGDGDGTAGTVTGDGSTTSSDITLGSGKIVTIPAGYYSSATTVRNGGSEINPGTPIALSSETNPRFGPQYPYKIITSVGKVFAVATYNAISSFDGATILKNGQAYESSHYYARLWIIKATATTITINSGSDTQTAYPIVIIPLN